MKRPPQIKERRLFLHNRRVPGKLHGEGFFKNQITFFKRLGELGI